MNPLAFNPWVIGGILLALSGTHLYAYKKGYDRATDAAASEKIKSVELAINQTESIARQDNEIAMKNMANSTEIRSRTRLIQTKESAHALAHPLPDNCILDPDRMRNINAAITGTIPTDTGQFDYTLPTAAAIGKK